MLGNLFKKVAKSTVSAARASQSSGANKQSAPQRSPLSVGAAAGATLGAAAKAKPVTPRPAAGAAAGASLGAAAAKAAPAATPFFPSIPGVPAQGALRLPAAPTYPVAPAGPTLEQRMAWDRAQREAAFELNAARNALTAATTQADADRKLAQAELARQFQAAGRAARVGYGDRGMALSPSAMGRTAHRLRDEEAAARAQVERNRANALREFQVAVERARLAQNQTAARVAEERALVGANRSVLLPGVRY